MRFGVDAPDPGVEREVPCTGLEKDEEALLRLKEGRWREASVRAASLNLFGALAAAAATTASGMIGSGSVSAVVAEAVVEVSAEGFSTPLGAAP